MSDYSEQKRLIDIMNSNYQLDTENYDYYRCTCMCHLPDMEVDHIVACCVNGWIKKEKQ